MRIGPIAIRYESREYVMFWQLFCPPSLRVAGSAVVDPTGKGLNVLDQYPTRRTGKRSRVHSRTPPTDDQQN